VPGNEYYLALQERSASYEGPHAELVHKTPDFFLLLNRLLVDRRVPNRYKAYFGQVLGFMTAPIDVLHEDFIGKATYLDDVCGAAAVLRVMARCSGPQLLDEHWHGGYDIYEVIDRVIRDADQLIGAGRLRLILESTGVVMDERERYSLDVDETDGW
jgi:uncharacterized membrane protein YkvA (DUF1232 family)